MRIISFLSIVFLSFVVSAQTDFGLWTGIETSVPLNKKVEFGLEGQLRWDNNVSSLEKMFAAVGTEFRLDKHVRTVLNYRLSGESYSPIYPTKTKTHRFTWDVNLRELNELFTDKSPLEVTVRLRWTNEHEVNERVNNYIRGRLELAYDVADGDITPYVSCEWFYHINDQIHYTATEVLTYNSINKVRLKFGSNFKLDDHHGLKLFMNYQRGIPDNDADIILGVGYKYEFNRILD